MNISDCCKRIAKGEDEAVEELLKHYAPIVKASALTITAEESTAKAMTSKILRELVDSIREQPYADPWELYLNESIERRLAAAEAEAHPAPPARAAQKKPRYRALRIVILSVLGACILLLLWVIFGMLTDLALHPRLDLGFTWFNNHVFNLF